MSEKCAKCGAPVHHAPPDGDLRYLPPVARARAEATPLAVSDLERARQWYDDLPPVSSEEEFLSSIAALIAAARAESPAKDWLAANKPGKGDG